MPPASQPYGARLRERTQPLAPHDDQYGYAHWVLCESIGRIFLELQQVFDPEDPIPPVAPILDVGLCPDWALPWLAQFVGVQLPEGTDPTTARALITSVAGWSRGTRAAMEAAAGLYLTGNKTVYFRERDTSAYQLEVVTITEETPDPTKVQAALAAQKPGGLILRYRTVTGWDYQQLASMAYLYSYVKAHFATYDKLRRNEPS
jgi:hypothetical protein